MLPKQKDIELPLLEVLRDVGGQARTADVHPLVTSKFAGITGADLAETLESGGSRWKNRIQWVRQKLVGQGDMDSPTWGVWGITDKGLKRLVSLPRPPEPLTFLESYEEYQEAFRGRLLGWLHDMSPRQFEHFARNLLLAYGFSDMEVTQVGSDGGIDGFGRLKIGLAFVRVAFQCKRWQGNVGRPEIDKFRGAISGDFEQGMFFTTSDFTDQAKKGSLKRGAVAIILLNGQSIVDLMIEKGAGVRRVPMYSYEMAPDDLLEPDSDQVAGVAFAHIRGRGAALPL